MWHMMRRQLCMQERNIRIMRMRIAVSRSFCLCHPRKVAWNDGNRKRQVGSGNWWRRRKSRESRTRILCCFCVPCPVGQRRIRKYLSRKGFRWSLRPKPVIFQQQRYRRCFLCCVYWIIHIRIFRWQQWWNPILESLHQKNWRRSGQNLRECCFISAWNSLHHPKNSRKKNRLRIRMLWKQKSNRRKNRFPILML